MGFVPTPKEREALVAKNDKNAERIFPYLSGEDVNSSPTQTFDRYAINFGDMTIDEATRWPDLLQILREKVKPELLQTVEQYAHQAESVSTLAGPSATIDDRTTRSPPC